MNGPGKRCFPGPFRFHQPGRDPEAPSGSPPTGSGYSLRPSYQVRPCLLPTTTPLSATPGPDLVSQIQRRRLDRYFVEGTVARVTREFRSDGRVSVRAEVSIMILTDPGRDLRMILSGAASSQQSRDTFNPNVERRMQDLALEGAVRGAFSRLMQTISASL